MKRLVVGEYVRVAYWSQNVDALRRAHATPLTRAEASELLSQLGVATGARPRRVVFRGRRGRCAHRRGVVTISLPPAPGPWPGAGLRVGLVLHEYAHLLNLRWRASKLLFGSGGHDRRFVTFLDGLVARTAAWPVCAARPWPVPENAVVAAGERERDAPGGRR